MMKKILTVAAALFFAVLLYGAVDIPVLDRIPGHRVIFSYSMETLRGGEKSDVTSGTAVVEDNSFKVSGFGIKVYSDGKTLWMVDEQAEEVVIQDVDPEDFQSNPVLIITGYKSLGDRLKVNSATDSSLDVTLTVDDDCTMRFIVKDIRMTEKAGTEDMLFDVSALPSSYVITDLR